MRTNILQSRATLAALSQEQVKREEDIKQFVNVDIIEIIILFSFFTLQPAKHDFVWHLKYTCWAFMKLFCYERYTNKDKFLMLLGRELL